MVKIDILLVKGDCEFCPAEGLYGIQVVIPAPETKEGTRNIFICECCLRTQLRKLQDLSYMENGDN